ncbi:MAG: hypothetical protein ILO43_05555 [Clostridia bacterium]|nr:hypothetical protein [Clostridia bacterium]MBP5272410.1 hypothetical protein [Clostridia bacterium]
MPEEKKTLPEESVLSDEQLSERAQKNREILKKTARVERFILLAVTAAFMIALIVMAIQMF